MARFFGGHDTLHAFTRAVPTSTGQFGEQANGAFRQVASDPAVHGAFRQVARDPAVLLADRVVEDFGSTSLQ